MKSLKLRTCFILLTVQGLHYCTGFSLAAASQGLLSIMVVCGLVVAADGPVAGRGIQGASALVVSSSGTQTQCGRQA